MAKQQSTQTADQLVPGPQFDAEMGVSRVTRWRWCQAGILKPLSINGRVYFRRSDIENLKDAAGRPGGVTGNADRAA